MTYSKFSLGIFDAILDNRNELARDYVLYFLVPSLQ
jgi:hypothetical protein